MTNVGMENDFANSLNLFQAAIDVTDNLEIIGTEVENGKDILIVENVAVDENVEGHQVTIEVSEIFAKVRSIEDANVFIDVINCSRKAIVCHGVTRIVGYYSRTHNWNKSKIGELRDRQNGSYGTPKFEKQYHEESCAVVDSL